MHRFFAVEAIAAIRRVTHVTHSLSATRVQRQHLVVVRRHVPARLVQLLSLRATHANVHSHVDSVLLAVIPVRHVRLVTPLQLRFT